MLKLLKYEIIESYRQYLLTFVVFLMLCAITPLVPMFISNILSILVAIAFAGIFIAIFLNIIISFNRSMYKRPGYLTLTLPVSTEKLIGAKLIGSLIWVAISTLVLMIGIMILTITTGEVSFLEFTELTRYSFAYIFNHFDVMVMKFVDTLAAIVMLILSFYLVITFTKTKFVPKYKAVAGIALYFIGWILIANILIKLSIANVNALMSIVLSVFLSVIFYVATVYLINHQIEVE